MSDGKPVLLPGIWDDDSVFDRGNGYLGVKSEKYPDADQPLLLFSTQALLKSLYPDTEMDEILRIDTSARALVEPEPSKVEPPIADDAAKGKDKGKDKRKKGTKGKDEDGNKGASKDVETDATKNGENKSEVGKDKDESTKDVVKDLAKDLAKNLAENLNTNVAEELAKDLAEELSEHLTKDKKESKDTKLTKKTKQDSQNGTGKDEQKEKDGDGAAKPESDEGKQKPIPAEYEPYQSLKSTENLTNSIEAAIMDIFRARNRKGRREREANGGPRLSRDEIRIKAKEHEQERRIAKQKSDAAPNKEDDTAKDDKVDASAKEDAEDEESDEVPDPPSILLVRTINSIRALFPHLFAITNHKRRDDKNLVIGKSRWKQKKTTMCWILGTSVFETSTRRRCVDQHSDAKAILATYIAHDLVDEIADHQYGNPQFWSTKWISAIVERATPDICNPLSILSTISPEETILNQAERLDTAYNNGKDIPMEEVQEQYRKSINVLYKRIAKLLTNRFPSARLSMYGSCLSELSLGHGADVDLSLFIPEVKQLKDKFNSGQIQAAKYESQMKKFVFQVCRKLEYLDHDFANMIPVPRARVPVVSGTFLKAQNPFCPDGSLNFDICFMNDIAVANSSLIREYSLVDIRVKKLILAVKQWAKDHRLNSAKNNFLSSYAWVNLVIFYLECIGLVPNLQSSELMATVGEKGNPKGNYWHFVNNLDTFTLTWSKVRDSGAWKQPTELAELPVPVLLYGFFEFYTQRFPSAFYGVCMKSGNISLPRTAFRKRFPFICIEDPFETHDSYCPHDLGMPASERATQIIMIHMCDATKHLGGVLTGKIDSDTMWPNIEVEVPPAPRRSRNNRGGNKKNDGQAKQDQDKSKGKTQGNTETKGNNPPNKDNATNAQKDGSKTEQKTGSSQNGGRGRGRNRGRNRGGRGRGGRGRDSGE